MTITLPNWRRLALFAATALVCAMPFLGAQQAGLEILEVRPSFFMIAGAGGNIGVQVGEDGVVVVDSGAGSNTAAVLAAIRKISPKPIRYIINTGPDADHVGGNETLAKAGEKLFSGGRNGASTEVPIVAVEGVLQLVVEGHLPESTWPSEVFHSPRKYMYLNGEGIEVLSQPSAHTLGDAFVFFRRSDVVVAGDVLDTRQFPVIDVARGGSIQGELAALSRLAELAIPSVPIVTREAGTIVIPGHGRLCDHYDVVEYRDMLTIIRDRVRDLLKAGRSLAQVQAAQPAKGYVGRYGNPERFIAAVYESLAKEAKQ
jgi:cyclase